MNINDIKTNDVETLRDLETNLIETILQHYDCLEEIQQENNKNITPSSFYNRAIQRDFFKLQCIRQEILYRFQTELLGNAVLIEKELDKKIEIVSSKYYEDNEICGYCSRNIGEKHKSYCRQ